MDNRIKRLADVLVHYSCNIQKGERVLIAYDGNSAKPLVKQIIKEVYAYLPVSVTIAADPSGAICSGWLM